MEVIDEERLTADQLAQKSDEDRLELAKETRVSARVQLHVHVEM